MPYSYHREWVDPHFDKSKPIAWDIETSLAPFGRSFGGKTRLVQLAQDGVCFIYDIFHINVSVIKTYLQDCHVYGHNLHYELSCLDFQGFIPREIDDTMYLARHKYPELESHSLKSVLAHLNIGVKADEGGSNWDSSLSKTQLDYAADDVLLLEEAYNKLKAAKDYTTYALDIESLKLAVHYQLNGFPVIESNRRKMVRAKKSLVKKAVAALPLNFNCNSYMQVRDLLQSQASDDAFLQKCTHQLAAPIRQQRSALKALNFLEKFKLPRIYGFFQPSGAVTGRFTCKGMGGAIPASQNLQQLPREMKSVFGYTEEDGRYLVDADFTSLEVYTAAGVMEATDIVDVLQSGQDFHTTTASMMYKKDYTEVTKDERQAAKVATFAFMYGAGKATGQAMYLKMVGIEITEDAAQELKNKWLSAYPKVKKYHRKMAASIKRLKAGEKLKLETPLGRPIAADKYTDSINFIPQSIGADCTKLSLLKLYTACPEVRVINTVHDSITLECFSFEEAERQAHILAQAMNDAWDVLKQQMPAVKELTMNTEADICKELGSPLKSITIRGKK